MLTSRLGGGAQGRACRRLAVAVICTACWGVGACGGGTAKDADGSEAGSASTPPTSAGASSSAAGNAAQAGGNAGTSTGGSASGASSSGGAALAGSSAQAGAPNASAGNGGVANNAGGAPGGDDDDDAVLPSPGCARGEPSGPEGDGTVRYVLPASYDGQKPLPLVFLLHATNILNDVERLKTDPRSAEYVLAGPQAVGAMSLGTFENGKADVEALLTKVLSEVCADQNHIFAAGNGSGGRVVMAWVAKRLKEEKAGVRAAAMVGTVYANNSAPLLPLLFIHPTQSNNSRSLAQDEDGTKAAKKLATLHGCGETTTPVEAASCMVNQMPIDPGCVDYQACTQPFRFCHHDDLSNQSAGDPWTCMASSAIFDFFALYR